VAGAGGASCPAALLVNKGTSASKFGFSVSTSPQRFFTVQPGPCITRTIGSLPLTARTIPSRFFAVRISQSKKSTWSAHSTKRIGVSFIDPRLIAIKRFS
jgi:hypothetical protein